MNIRMMTLTVLLSICFSAPAMAAEGKTCDAFVAAFSKAGKLVTGKDLSSDDAAFWKKQCAKKAEAEVKKEIECFNAAKVQDDVGKCMK